VLNRSPHTHLSDACIHYRAAARSDDCATPNRNRIAMGVLRVGYRKIEIEVIVAKDGDALAAMKKFEAGRRL
jgi:hypothetical protein